MHDPAHGAVPAGLHRRLPRGVPLMVMQVPGLPASLHDWQVPMHPAEQHTPSVQLPVMHSVPVPQGVPLLFSALHVPPEQVSELLHVVPPQQGCPAAPQTQVALADAQVRLVPQAGALAQQAWLAPPHATQLPVAPQIAPALQVDPLQQGWPGAPHSVHCPDEQVSVVPEQVLPAQQTLPIAPHGMQLPPEQTVPDAVQVLLAQHA
jgi:hypothetical protein